MASTKKEPRLRCKQYVKEWLPDVYNDLEVAGGIPRLRAIASRKNIWANGSTITYKCLDSDPRRTKLVHDAVALWSTYAGLKVVKVGASDPANVRIRFLNGDGHWSYVGTYVLQVTQGPTMNLDHGASLDTAVHEWGHTLGLQHEHQHPNGPEWNEDAVISELSGPPNNWPIHVIRRNVLNKHSWREVMGDVYDHNSIMHYDFDESWLSPEWQRKFPRGIDPEPGISDTDIRLIQTWYPKHPSGKVLSIGANSIFIANAGDTAVCEFTPTQSGSYTFRTGGRADTVMVIEAEGQKRVDDDSGYARNAKITMDLSAGTKADVLLRLYWKDQVADFKLFIKKTNSFLQGVASKRGRVMLSFLKKDTHI